MPKSFKIAVLALVLWVGVSFLIPKLLGVKRSQFVDPICRAQYHRGTGGRGLHLVGNAECRG